METEGEGEVDNRRQELGGTAQQVNIIENLNVAVDNLSVSNEEENENIEVENVATKIENLDIGDVMNEVIESGEVIAKRKISDEALKDGKKIKGSETKDVVDDENTEDSVHKEEEGRELVHMESVESAASTASSKDPVLGGSSSSEADRMDVESSKPSGSDTPDSPSSIYQVKWVQWGEIRCPVITQNENGPCPLISIVNVLLLRGKFSLPDGCQVISAGQLLEYLGDLLLELSPVEGDAKLDFQHNINDAISVLPKLQTGLDVNVKFTGVSDFEYTEECLIFDLLNISLYHGWLVDPQREEVTVAVNNLSYNQLVETIICDRSSSDSLALSRALVAEQWLDESQAQLTYHGLCELNSTIKEGELAVFFRNNHFSTVHKAKDELFLLVTDQGFLDQPKVVWETLGNIEGDTEFVDHQFQQQEGQGSLASSPVSGAELVDKDHALALALGRQEEEGREREQEWQDFKEHLGSSEGMTDAQLAARLQEAENQAAAEEARQEGGAVQPGPSNPIGPRAAGGKKDKNCTIL